MIDGVRVEADQDGFELILEGDLSHEAVLYLEDHDTPAMRLRLSRDAAIELLAQTRAEIGPWVAEMEAARVEYAAASPEERGVVLGLIDRLDPDDILADLGDVTRRRARGA